jgi:Cys-tRNA(Pro)/Cys-tRNA(Cys) deacylase
MGAMSAQVTRAVDVVRRARVPHTVHAYAHDPSATRPGGGPGYALEAVDALGLEPARVFKTIVVEVDGRLVLAAVPADTDVDLKSVAAALGGRRAAIAPAADAERATGYVLGGISPLGTRRSMPMLIDSSALDHPSIHVSAGRRGLEIELAPGDLVALTRAASAAIARRAR